MPEQEFDVKPIGIEYICDECGKGIMRPHGNFVLTSNPIQHPHKCHEWGHTDNFTKKYPDIVYRSI